MKSLLLGSKAIGAGAMAVLRAQSQLVGIVTIDDRHDTRSRFELLVREGAIVADSNHRLEAVVGEAQPDFVFVAGWYRLLPPTLLEMATFVGIHHSLLPRYRGGSPLVWALIHGDHEVGTSLFTLGPGIDDGPIWSQATVEAGDGYIGDVVERCDMAALALLPKVLSGEGRPREQDHAHATFCRQRYPGDGLIDWSDTAGAVVRFIRAQSRPYPGAFTSDRDGRVTIWRASESDLTSLRSPGQTNPVGRHLGVVCGDSRVVVLEETSRPIGPGVVLSSPAHAVSRRLEGRKQIVGNALRQRPR